MEVLSAGISSDSETELTAELVEWADRIFVMERRQRTKIKAQYGEEIGDRKIVSLDIADKYKFMDDELVDLLERRMAPFLA